MARAHGLEQIPAAGPPPPGAGGGVFLR